MTATPTPPPTGAPPTGTPSGSPTGPAAAVLPPKLLATLLEGERAAVWAYGLGGALLAGSPRRPRARSGYAAHLAAVATLTQALVAASATPAPAPAAYSAPALAGSGAVAAFLAGVEGRLAAAYADGVAATEGAARAALAESLQEAAVRAAGWAGTTSAFPGLPERGGA